jgi:hypothetical protein
MADEKKGGTIYQQLTQFLNVGGMDLQTAQPTVSASTPPKESKIIIKGTSPEEIHRKGLELQQKRELQNKFFRTTDRGFQKALQYEAARLPAYIDYEGMEYYPIISSALDLFMEETTTVGLNGKMLNIYSNKERIKMLLEEFFYDTLNVNVNLPFWVRNLVKYGDNFVLLYGERKKGITHVKQLVNYEIERYERIQNGKPSVKFKERMTGDEFNVFEIAHFRLLGDDKYLPYGSSVLNKVRRVFRQLVMAEDAMLTYRIIRAGEKKVFKIDVGNIDEDDIEEYIYKVATKFKKTAQVAPNDGQIDYRFNILGNDEDYFLPVRNANTQTGIDTLPGACLALDTKIELLDGRSLELNEIINEFNSGKELWSYSINPETGEIVPGKITWAGITRKNTDVVKITLDNGETITCTPDHKFLLREFKKIEAKDLVVGNSLMPFYKRTKEIYKKKEYEQIFDISKNKWINTHKMVSDYMENYNNEKNLINVINLINDINKYNVTHHKDFNRFNNNPSNLIKMGNVDHINYHSSINSPEFNWWNNANISNEIKFNAKKHIGETLSKCGIENWKSDVYKEKMSDLRKNLWKNEEYIKKTTTKQNEYVNSFESYNYSDELHTLLIKLGRDAKNVADLLTKLNSSDDFIENYNDGRKKIYKYKFISIIKIRGIYSIFKYFNYNGFNDFKHKVPCYNHKIVSIDFLPDKMDTGTITIDGKEELHSYHTFATTCGIFTYNSNLDAIQDIEYLRDNLFIGLGIPKPFLSFQDAAGAGKNMAQYDIRFSKKINRIQQAMIQELNKMAMIHLYLLGYNGEDLSDFTLTLTNPSTQQELLKSELLREKAQTYTELTRAEAGIAAMSHTGAKRMLFNMSDREIVEDLKQQKMEKVVMQELMDSPVTIKKSGLFTDIDKRFGEPEAATIGAPSGGTEQGGMPPAGGGATGMPPAGGGMPPAGGGGMPAATPAGVGGMPPAGGGMPPLAESRMTEEQYNDHLEKLIFGTTKQPEQKQENRHKEIIKENNEINTKLNENAEAMINEINVLLENTESINKQKELNETEDIDFENIENIELNEE